MIRIFLQYLWGAFVAPSEPGKDIAGQANWCLRYKHSFRLPDNAEKDPFIVLKELIRLYRRRSNTPVLSTQNQSLIFDSRSKAERVRRAHIAENIQAPDQAFLARDQMGFRSGRHALMHIVSITPLVLFLVFPISLFHKKKRNIALLLREAMEGAFLLGYMKKNTIQKIYWYCPYEKDANKLYLLIRNTGATCIKLPSPNLLAFHHIVILADALAIGSPYQLDELQSGEITHNNPEVLNWTPESYQSYRNIYQHWDNPASRTIGFYSHGHRIRAKLGHGDTYGELSAEKVLLDLLSQYLRQHPDNRLVIFLHPKEKADSEWEETQLFYAQKFNGCNYELADRSVPGTQAFHHCSVGIGSLSTILFERIFCGFNTLFYAPDIPGFPVSSKLKDLCTHTPEQLSDALEKWSALPADHIQQNPDLKKYTHAGWLAS